MSYPKELDEFTEAELRAEIRRRLRMRATGRCDYCERHVSTGACRFPQRHKIMRGLHSRWEVRRGAVLTDEVKAPLCTSDQGAFTP